MFWFFLAQKLWQLMKRGTNREVDGQLDQLLTETQLELAYFITGKGRTDKGSNNVKLNLGHFISLDPMVMVNG